MLYWMSFVSEKGFLGACIARGKNFDEALRESWIRECNPGGEVKALQVPRLGPYEAWKLYSHDDLERIDGAVKWDDSLGIDPINEPGDQS